jgi:hypothetical protein
MPKDKTNDYQRRWWTIRFEGCGTGCCLGAISAPFLFFLFLEVLYRVAGDFNAEGVPFFMVMSVPLGAIVGAALYPISRTLLLLFIAKISNKSNRP